MANVRPSNPHGQICPEPKHVHMRRLLGAVTLLLLAVSSMAAAQEQVILIETSVNPATYTFRTDDYQTDENGDRIKDENGAFVPVVQTVSLSLFASMECATAPTGEKINFFPTGNTTKVTENGVERAIIVLEPNNITIEWVQNETLGTWIAEKVIDVQIKNQAKPDHTITENYTWVPEMVDIPSQCPQDRYDLQTQSHQIIVPGFDIEDNTPQGDDNEEQGTPTVATPLIVGAILFLAMAMPRRVS
jgi:hypothetical protein